MLELIAVKVARSVLRRGGNCEISFLSDYIGKLFIISSANKTKENKMKKLILSTLIAGSMLLNADAFEECNAENSSTDGMLNCTKEEIRYQDKQLNIKYKKLIEILEEDKKKELKTTQRAWIKYRDAKCIYEIDEDGGSIGRILSEPACIAEMTKQRAEELQRDISMRQ